MMCMRYEFAWIKVAEIRGGEAGKSYRVRTGDFKPGTRMRVSGIVNNNRNT